MNGVIEDAAVGQTVVLTLPAGVKPTTAEAWHLYVDQYKAVLDAAWGAVETAATIGDALAPTRESAVPFQAASVAPYADGKSPFVVASRRAC